MEETTQYVASYQEVSYELGKKLITLYGEKIFPRQGKIFADMLYQTGIEAGAFLASLADITERTVKVELATNAMIKLNQTNYLLYFMKEAKYYTPKQVEDLELYMVGLLKAMRDLLDNAYAQIREENMRTYRPPVAQPIAQPAAAPSPTVQPAQASKAQPKASVKPKANPDPDGFNAPV